MTATRTDAGVRTFADLVAILPETVAIRVEAFWFWPPQAFAALRVLALIDAEDWHGAVKGHRIDPWAILAWAKGLLDTSRARVLAEIAVGFFLEEDGVHVPVARSLVQLDDDADFAAVLDALRIAREGLES